MVDYNRKTGDIVVATHGICSSTLIIRPLVSRLQRIGYESRIWSYFSLRGSIRDIGSRFAEYLHELADQNPGRNIHIVAHSMGSIVSRCAIMAGVPDSLARVVMIAPPNRGSHVARQLIPIYGWFCSTLVELSDASDSFVNRLPREVHGPEVGIISVTRDRVVKPEATRLDNHRDHTVVDSWHTGVLWRRDTAKLVDTFLKSGQFAAAPELVTA